MPGNIWASESAKTLSAVKNRFPQEHALALKGFHGQLVVNHGGSIIGILSFQYYSIASIYNSDWRSDQVNLEKYIVSKKGLQIKPLALIDPGVGLDCYRATCFITFTNKNGVKDFATGVLVKYRAKRFILTNFHVLGSVKEAGEAWLEFRALLPPLRVKLDPGKLHWAMHSLDFALVAISLQSLRDLKEVQPLELSSEDCFNAMEIQIIGYPAGNCAIVLTDRQS